MAGQSNESLKFSGGRVWHIKRVIAYIGLAAEMAVLPAGTGAEDLPGEPARKVTLANIGEPAKCATE